MPTPPDTDDQLIKDLRNRPSMDSAENIAMMKELQARIREREKLAVKLELDEKNVRIRHLEERVELLEADNTTKTNELRTLNRSATEERVARLVTERVDAATLVLQNDLAAARR